MRIALHLHEQKKSQAKSRDQILLEERAVGTKYKLSVALAGEKRVRLRTRPSDMSESFREIIHQMQ